MQRTPFSKNAYYARKTAFIEKVYECCICYNLVSLKKILKEKIALKKLTAHETLRYVIALLTYYLDELGNAKEFDENQFEYGEKTAFVECLEIIQRWEHAAENGLDFDVENRFPL